MSRYLNARQVLIHLFGILLPAISIAQQPQIKENVKKQYIFGLDLGLSAPSNLGNSTSIPLGYSTFSYQAQHHNDFGPLRFGATLSRRLIFTPKNALDIGLSYHTISSMLINGNLNQGIYPLYYPATYQYSVKASQLLAEAKLVHQWHDLFYPYIITSVGGGFNKAQHYSTNIPEFMTITPMYANHSKASFSYTAGVGVGYFITEPISLGLGYRFSDLGSVGLGNGTIRYTTISSPLKQSHIYLNTLLIELNCFF